MKKLLCVLLILFGLPVSNSLYARSVLARHEERFFKEVNKRQLAIALFYHDYRASRHCDSGQAETMLRAERIFDRVATICCFKEGGLIFIKASVLCEDMKELACSLGILRIPTCILFKESELVRDENGKPAMLTSIHSQDALVRFIKKYLRKELNENRDEYWHRQEMRALNGPQLSVGVQVGGWGPGWGYYDPYDYYPWIYYGGLGYGRGCCNRRCHAQSGCRCPRRK